jgi:hypothetical protein
VVRVADRTGQRRDRLDAVRLQAALGAGFIGYYIGVGRTREKMRREIEQLRKPPAKRKRPVTGADRAVRVRQPLAIRFAGGEGLFCLGGFVAAFAAGGRKRPPPSPR